MTRSIVEVKRWLRTSPVPGVQAAKNAYLLDVGQFIRGQARANVRKRTRKLMNSIKRSGLEPSGTSKTVTVRVYSTMPLQAQWEEEGTGIYGPLKRVIRPRRAKVLAWPAGYGTLVNPLQGRPKATGKIKAPARRVDMIFRKWVRGKRGSKFMSKAAEGAATKAYETTRRAQMEREIKNALESAVK